MARTHIGDDGDEGVGDGEGKTLRGSRLEALLHQGETVLPTEQADVAQQVQRNLHVLGVGGCGGVGGATDKTTSDPSHHPDLLTAVMKPVLKFNLKVP